MKKEEINVYCFPSCSCICILSPATKQREREESEGRIKRMNNVFLPTPLDQRKHKGGKENNTRVTVCFYHHRRQGKRASEGKEK